MIRQVKSETQRVYNFLIDSRWSCGKDERPGSRSLASALLKLQVKNNFLPYKSVTLDDLPTTTLQAAAD